MAREVVQNILPSHFGNEPMIGLVQDAGARTVEADQLDLVMAFLIRRLRRVELDEG